MSRVLGLTNGTDAAANRAGQYRSLHKYLRDRYADRVVLTFAQIEDLVGFPLPEAARRDKDWWSGRDATGHPSGQSESWTLADRTATVNLSARTVLFERQA